ncbi:MAG: hypothetical protein CL912_30340 [Deltaproteobacteria bacterium]|nr:hypothetical protein [Deltaproteobacteria bacterium]
MVREREKSLAYCFKNSSQLTNRTLDELLNRIWYAGAYTCQLCLFFQPIQRVAAHKLAGTLDPKHGNTLNDFYATSFDPAHPNKNWYANTTISNGTSVIVDGAKRDKLIWPGGECQP